MNTGSAEVTISGDAVTIGLPYLPPFPWHQILDWLEPRAVPGLEAIQGESYIRTIDLDGNQGLMTVRPSVAGDNLEAVIRLPSGIPVVHPSITQAVARLRRLFDLDTDTAEIDAHLAKDPILTPLVSATPGLRIPGTWDPFELSVRAVAGQQITVSAATALVGRIVAQYAEPVKHPARAPMPPGLTHLFPPPAALMSIDSARLRIPRSRAAALMTIAAAFASRPDFLEGGSPEDIVQILCHLRGIGPWTAHYIAMRALGQRDAFPAADIGLRKALRSGSGAVPSAGDVLNRAAAWRPFRAYAAFHLWRSLTSAARRRSEQS